MHLTLALVAASPLLALSAPLRTSTCSWETGPICSCPSGTNYQSSTSYAIIGANILDVKAIAGHFQDTAWFGTTPAAVTGQDNADGCTRTLVAGMSVGTFDIIEQLDGYTAESDGSFEMKFSLQNVPLTYNSTNGTGEFYGDWDTLTATSLSHCETGVAWSIYACFTPNGGFKSFHESAIANLTSILRSRGQLNGITLPTISY